MDKICGKSEARVITAGIRSLIENLRHHSCPILSPLVLVEGFQKAVIDEAFEMHKILDKEKAAIRETRSVEEYLGERKEK